MRIALLVFVMLLMSSCSSNTNNWPYGMTPFFAECEYDSQMVYIQIRNGVKENISLVEQAGNFTIEANQL